MPGTDKLNEVLTQICSFADQAAEPLGLAIVDVKFSQQGRRRTLEVTIHRARGSVSLDDCENVSRALEKILDDRINEHGPLFEGAYLLEVQSPGIDRLLKTEREFRVFQGQKVIVQAKQKVEDLGDKFTGTLVQVHDGTLTLAQAQSAVAKKEPPAVKDLLTIEMTNLAHIRLHPLPLNRAELNAQTESVSECTGD